MRIGHQGEDDKPRRFGECTDLLRGDEHLPGSAAPV